MCYFDLITQNNTICEYNYKWCPFIYDIHVPMYLIHCNQVLTRNLTEL